VVGPAGPGGHHLGGGGGEHAGYGRAGRRKYVPGLLRCCRATGEQRMTRQTASARRVLVLRCPDWLDDDGSAGPGNGDSGSSDSAAARAFEPVGAIVENFCPQVEVLQPGVCAIATRGPARYFGGEAQLAAGLAEAVAWVGVTCQAGIADGLFAAGLAARAGPTGLLVPPGETPEFL